MSGILVLFLIIWFGLLLLGLLLGIPNEAAVWWSLKTGALISCISRVNVGISAHAKAREGCSTTEKGERSSVKAGSEIRHWTSWASKGCCTTEEAQVTEDTCGQGCLNWRLRYGALQRSWERRELMKTHWVAWHHTRRELLIRVAWHGSHNWLKEANNRVSKRRSQCWLLRGSWSGLLLRLGKKRHWLLLLIPSVSGVVRLLLLLGTSWNFNRELLLIHISLPKDLLHVKASLECHVITTKGLSTLDVWVEIRHPPIFVSPLVLLGLIDIVH